MKEDIEKELKGILCNTIKSYDPFLTAQTNCITGIDEAVHYISKLISQWIPVSERLPEPDQYVIGYFPVLRKYYREMQFVKLFTPTGGKRCWVTMSYDNDYEFGYMSHWMPIPELPK